MIRKIGIIIGPPGSGKGTQAFALREYCKDIQGPEDEVVLFDQGAAFRQHSEKAGREDESVLTRLIDDGIDKGNLLPSAAAIYHWVRAFGRVPHGKNLFMVMDGVWRTFDEIPVALNFLQAINAELTVFRLEVPKEVCQNRLLLRKRKDDNEEVIQNRITKYFEQTLKVAEAFQNAAKEYSFATKFISINGDATIDEVSKQIKAGFFPN